MMHVLNEGICRKQIMRIFEVWTQTKRTDAIEIKSCLENFTYGYSIKKNIIKHFSSHDLEKNDFITSSAQMKTLIDLFPFVFEHIIDTNHEEYEYLILFAYNKLK